MYKAHNGDETGEFNPPIKAPGRWLNKFRGLQRNRNVMAVLEQRQSQEETKRIGEIRLSLAPPRTQARLQQLQSGSMQRRAAQTAAAVQLGGGPDFGVLNVGGIIGTEGADAPSSPTLKRLGLITK